MWAKLAIKLRAMQIYYHFAHNFCHGPVFMQDHESFAKFYDECEDDYDGVAEQALVKEGEQAICPKMQLKGIYGIIKELRCTDADDNKVLYSEGLKLEKDLCLWIEEMGQSGLSLGCETLIGDICRRSQVRQYLIGQRIK